MATQHIHVAGLILSAALVLHGPALQADSPTLSQQLLQAYFDTAGVCTTSKVTDIRDSGTVVTVEIEVEPMTRKGLTSMPNDSRDDWFSLHCPPEIHGVWHQAEPPTDIRVIGNLGEGMGNDTQYTLSCVDYQSAQWGTRELTLRNKIQLWLEEKLNN